MSDHSPRKYIWYIEALNQDTNAAIARLLAESDACPEQVCADGKRRNLWRCPAELISMFRRSNGSTFAFAVFNQEGTHGKIRPFNFSSSVKKRAQVVAPAVAARLKRVKRFKS